MIEISVVCAKLGVLHRNMLENQALGGTIILCVSRTKTDYFGLPNIGIPFLHIP